MDRDEQTQLREVRLKISRQLAPYERKLKRAAGEALGHDILRAQKRARRCETVDLARSLAKVRKHRRGRRLLRVLMQCTPVHQWAAVWIVQYARGHARCRHFDDECGECGRACANDDCLERLDCLHACFDGSHCSWDCSIEHAKALGLVSDSELDADTDDDSDA